MTASFNKTSRTSAAAPLLARAPSLKPLVSMLARRCECGRHTSGGPCPECQRHDRRPSQRSRAIDAARSEPARPPRIPIRNPVAVSPPPAPPVRAQASLAISGPHDVAETEARHIARNVMLMPSPASTGLSTAAPACRLMPPMIARSAPGGDGIGGGGGVSTPPAVSSALRSGGASGGQALPIDVRRFMEPRFGADFSRVRIHTDNDAAWMNRRLSAHAFTVGPDIYFGRGQFAPHTITGRELIAHELTHTIQQGGVHQYDVSPIHSAASIPRVQAAAPIGGPQALGMSDAIGYLADKANAIPGFRAMTIVLGVNPINQRPVDRNAANILRALVEFMPGGAVITHVLDQYGVFDKAGRWIEPQVATLGLSATAIKKSLTDFLESLSWKDILDLGGVWARAKASLAEPVTRLIETAKSLAAGVTELIRDAVLRPLAKYAESTPAYSLLKAVLGEDPITGEPTSRNAENLIAPFMKLIGQEEIWENMQKANAIPRCWAWFQNALTGLLRFVRQIPKQFVIAFKALQISDLLDLPKTFVRLAGVFGSFAARFFAWGLSTGWKLLEIIAEAVSPGAMAYLRKTGTALLSILKNPIPFVGNLVRAAKLGFQNFGANFLTHLKNGLIDWLTGSFPGVYIPKALSLGEIGRFSLSVLGVTWTQIRGKIVKALGDNGERIMSGLETAFDFIVALVKGGPAAVWELIKEKLSGMYDVVLGGISSFVMDIVVKRAIPKLISYFIPGAGFISAIMSIYDTVMVFVHKIAHIVAVVKGFVDSIVHIAAGVVDAAAAKVESVLAGAISLAINFFAGFVGLGNVAEKIAGVLERVRAMVDKALEVAIKRIVTKAKALFARLFGSKPADKAAAQSGSDGVKSEARKALLAKLASPHAREEITTITAGVLQQYKPLGLKNLVLENAADGNGYDVFAEASPRSLIAKAMRKGHAVTLRAEIELSEPVPARLRGVASFAKVAKRDKVGKVVVKDGQVVMEVAQNVGAAIEPASFEGGGARAASAGGLLTPYEEGATKLELHTWNVGEAQYESSSSHAEAQLREFLVRNYQVLWRIKSLHVRITDSPCGDCIETLCFIQSQMPKHAKASLVYEKPYKSLKNPSKSTTPAMLSRLVSCGWSIDGPEVGGTIELTTVSAS
jgi:hypothetical protein